MRRRRRDLALLRTLGFTGRQLLTTVAWQATVMVGFAALVAVPVGIVVGRWAWSIFATELRVVDQPVVPASALVGALRRFDDAVVPYVGVLAGVAVLSLFAVAIIQTNGRPDDARQEGDFGLFAQDTEFVPDTIDSAAGEIGVFIGNDDLVRHNFTIDELAVDEELASKAFVRFSFEAEPGTYEFYCDIPGHEDMTGTLTTVGG